MSQHNPSNSNCDLVQYPGAANVVCTCDEDTPAPSVTLPTIQTPMGSGVIVPAGHGAALSEFNEAARELDRARKLMQPAQERFARAVDALAAQAIAR